MKAIQLLKNFARYRADMRACIGVSATYLPTWEADQAAILAEIARLEGLSELRDWHAAHRDEYAAHLQEMLDAYRAGRSDLKGHVKHYQRTYERHSAAVNDLEF